MLCWLDNIFLKGTSFEEGVKEAPTFSMDTSFEEEAEEVPVLPAGMYMDTVSIGNINS